MRRTGSRSTTTMCCGGRRPWGSDSAARGSGSGAVTRQSVLGRPASMGRRPASSGGGGGGVSGGGGAGRSRRGGGGARGGGGGAGGRPKVARCPVARGAPAL